jgi:serine protease
MARRRRPARSAPSRTPRSPGRADRVVVKFRDFVVLPYEDGAERFVRELKVGPWSRLARQFPGIHLNRLFTTLASDLISKLVYEANGLDQSYRPPNLLAYFVIPSPPNVDPNSLARELSTWPSVETAYVDAEDQTPSAPAGTNPDASQQQHLDAGPGGIDARFAWPFAGGAAEGQRLIDLERGYTLNHEDLAAHNAQLLIGVIDNTERFHGTSSLGVVCAVDNDRGGIGVAFNVASVDAVSQVTNSGGVDRPNAMLAAIDHFTQPGQSAFGRVLLLEVQLNPLPGWGGTTWAKMPMETLPADFDVIRLATALGIVVVEAAGNGRNDLDTFREPVGGAYTLQRGSAGFKDSGALLVAGGSATTPHIRWVYTLDPTQGSNYGSRVDCYASAENVYTCTSDFFGATTLYWDTFGGTSAAAAIVTGAALVVQGVAEASLGYRMSPRQLGAILRDPAYSTLSSNPDPTTGDRIGVMPDLRKILQSALGIAPDLYLRDFVGDTGDPHVGAISASPDVILLPAQVADPQASFGQGSGTDNDDALGSEATAGQDNYIYVRVLNRGAAAAANAAVTVYWAPPSSLVTPDLWTSIGTLPIASVPAGNVLTAWGPLVWPTGAIPGPGHYCFVAVVGNVLDPAPDPASFLDFDNFVRYIRENNNVTWRNFNVV